MSDYQHRLGDRLRAIRSQQGLTLQDVEETSHGVWKAVVVGSYERGDRAISVAKLSRLAEFYGVPVADLLPTNGLKIGGEGEAPSLVLDLTVLSRFGQEEGPMAALQRFAMRIQADRGDYNGRVLTLRADDVRAIAIAFGQDPSTLVDRLREASAVRV